MSYYDDYSYFYPRQQMPYGGSTMQNFPVMQQQGIPMQQQIPLPQLPSGVPAGTMVGPVPGAGMPLFPETTPTESQPPETLQNTAFVPGFLATQIGKLVRVEFLIGTTGPLVDRTGTLLEVGASYILIRPVETDDILMCDLYSIKFVNILL